MYAAAAVGHGYARINATRTSLNFQASVLAPFM